MYIYSVVKIVCVDNIYVFVLENDPKPLLLINPMTSLYPKKENAEAGCI